MRILQLSFMALIFASCLVAQQNKAQRPSPPGTAELTLDGKQITVDYSRPRIADPKTGQPRTIMGSLVPYGKVWRTGANEATTLKTDGDIAISGTLVPAGAYTLFTVPESDKWTLVISKKTGEWGTPYPGEKDDFARVPMTVQHLDSVVDPFTITLVQKSDSKPAQLCVTWERTQACADIAAK